MHVLAVVACLAGGYVGTYMHTYIRRYVIITKMVSMKHGKESHKYMYIYIHT